MSKVLIIGCGGVASVAIHKCCQVPEVFIDLPGDLRGISLGRTDGRVDQIEGIGWI